jgi:hypothetical protein
VAVNELIVSGKWATGTNWSAGEKPKASHDVVIPAGKEVKIEAAAVGRSLLCEGSIPTQSAKLTLGNNEKPEGPAGANWFLKVVAGASISGMKGELVFASTFEGAEQKISIDKSLTVAASVSWLGSKAKYLLEEQLTLATTLTTSTGTILNTNGKLVKGTSITCSGENVKVTLGASKLELSGTWQGPAGTGSTLSAAESTILLTGTESKFEGNSLTYGTVTIEAAGIEVVGSNTIKTLTLKTAGFAATKFMKGSTQTVEAFKAEGGKAGSLVKMESTEAGKEWKLHKVAGNVNVSFIEVKDSHVDAAPKWYGGAKVTESVFLTGNENWLEEVEPGGATTLAVHGGGRIALGGGVVSQGAPLIHGGGQTRVVGSKVSVTQLAVTGGGRPIIVGSRVSEAGLAVTAGGRTTVASFALVSGTVQVHGGGRTTMATFASRAGPVVIHGGGATRLSSFQQPQASPVIHGGGRIVLAGHVVGFQAVRVTGGGSTTVSGFQQPTGTLAVHGGGRISITGQAPLTPVTLHGGGQVRLVAFQQPQASLTVHGGGSVALSIGHPEPAHARIEIVNGRVAAIEIGNLRPARIEIVNLRGAGLAVR